MSQKVMTNDMLEEVVALGLENHELFCQSFFPATVRDPFPPFSNDLWELLEDPTAPYVNAQLFRGAGKTTNFRMFAMRRICYGVSRTILYIGKSQSKAIESLQWIKSQVEKNKNLTATFGLEEGNSWSDIKLEIRHKKLGISIWVLAFGITGPVRGVNIEDYRPDLIIVDDVVDEENANNDIQCQKISDLVFGALMNSLAPQSESPSAKLAILQTPLSIMDVSTQALKDPTFKSLSQGIWTKETENKPLEFRESVWEERFPTKLMRQKKLGFVARNNLSVWMREMEVKIVSAETASFKQEWLQYYDNDSQPDRSEMVVILVIDPVPKPTDEAVRKGLNDRDYECITALGYTRGKYYVLEYRTSRGHDPSWTIKNFFEMRHRWRPRKLVVDSVAYQTTLSWILTTEMKKRGLYTQVEEYIDRRSKFNRIVDNIKSVAANGALYIRAEQTELISQFTLYKNVTHDDVLETVAIGIEGMFTVELGDDEYQDITEDEYNIPSISHSGGCP